MQLVKTFILAAAVTSAASALPIGTKAWERDMVGDEVVRLAARNPPWTNNDISGHYTLQDGTHVPKEQVNPNPAPPAYNPQDPRPPGYTPGAHGNPPTTTPELNDVGNLLGQHGGNSGSGHSSRDVVGDEVVWLAARNPLWSKLGSFLGGSKDKTGYFTGPGGTRIPKEPPAYSQHNPNPAPARGAQNNPPPLQDLSNLVPPGTHQL